MKEVQKPSQVTKNRFLSIVFWLFTGIVTLWLILLVAIQFSFFQTWLTEKTLAWLSENISTEIHVENVKIQWFDEIVLKDIHIKDNEDSTMIRVPELIVDFNVLNIPYQGNNLRFDAVRLVNPQVHLIKHNDESYINITEFINQIKALSKPSDKQKKPFSLAIGKIKLDKGIFSLNDQRKDSLYDRFDYFHIQFDSLNGNFSNFTLRQDTLDLTINNLVGNDKSNWLNIQNFAANLSFAPTHLIFDDFQLETGKSFITDSVALTFTSPSNLSYFIDSVKMDVRLNNSTIDFQDAAAFVPNWADINSKVAITGSFSGYVNRLRSEGIRLSMGGSSYLEGDFYLNGLPNVSETFIDLKVNSGRIIPSDIRPVIKNNYDLVQGVGPVGVQAQFLGFVNDFVANGFFRTETGLIETDLNLKIPADFEMTEYRGALRLQNFNLGRVLKNEAVFQQIDMEGEINGSGITIPKADFFLDAKVARLGINDYDYQQITTSGALASGFFEGSLNINDPNLKVDLDGRIDLRNNKEIINSSLTIDTAALYALKLHPEPFNLQSNIRLDLENFNLDSLEGSADILNTTVFRNNHSAEIDSITFYSIRNQKQRQVRLFSEVADIAIDGDFLFSAVYRDLSRLYKEYILNFQNNSVELDAYYSNAGQEALDEYSISAELNLKNINNLSALFIDDFKISQNTKIEGSFRHGNTSILRLFSSVDTLALGQKLFTGNEFELTTSKIADSTQVLAMFYINSGQQQWQNITPTQNALVEAIWNGEHIDFQMTIDQEKLKNYASIYGMVDFLRDTTLMQLEPSDITLFEKNWKFSEKNKIEFANQNILINDLQLYTDQESIAVEGILADTLDQVVSIDINAFDIANSRSVLPILLEGKLDGSVVIQNALGTPLIDNNLTIDAFKVDGFLVGDVMSASIWENEKKRLKTALSVIREEQRVININGYFIPNDPINQLQMTADIKGARLNVLQPFARNNFSNINGEVFGKFDIRGTTDYPILKGAGEIQGGTVGVNYLQTEYEFNGDIVFQENEIGMRQVQVFDQDGNQAYVNGGVFHDGFKNFILDISADMTAFQVLNTNSTDNELYYGTAYATGNVNLLGSVSNLNITANAISEKGTRISIPLGSTTSINQEEYISFVDMAHPDSQPSEALEELPEIDLSGLSLDFNLEFTPDAYIELIFDIKSGDIIRGRGNGNLDLQIDTNGDFNMFGDFNIQNGAYNFTLYNIINKEFDIREDSRISWYGDPYGAILNIDAEYSQLVSMAPLMATLDEESLNSPAVRRKYPATVTLNLQGEMLQPEITFDIDFEDYPDNILLQNGTAVSLNALVNGFKSRIESDEQELKRQVFSLIILRRLSPENSFSVAGGQTIGNSVSEFVSNQLSYWITQVDENLEIDVDLNSLDEDALNTFQLRLAYTFFDGRLRVSRDGGFFNPNTNQSDLASILGDWTVEYLLTPDGKLRVKMFNRIDQNAFSGLNNSINETGFSLQYIKSFDQLKNVISRIKDRIEDKKEPEPDPTARN